MLDADHDKIYGKFNTFYKTQTQGLSPAELAQHYTDDLFTRLSDPLKKMQVDLLTRTGKNCYKAKHVDDNFTNLEQINLCKQMEWQKIFGKFARMQANHRDSEHFHLQDCL